MKDMLYEAVELSPSPESKLVLLLRQNFILFVSLS